MSSLRFAAALFAALPFTSQDPKPAVPRPETIRDVADEGSRPALDVDLPDEAPLPRREPGSPGRAADGPVKPGSGDPSVLGFVAGEFAPPAGERVDPRLEAAVARIDASRPERVVYGFVVFGKRITASRLETLSSLGVRLLGFHPNYAWKAAIPADVLEVVAGLDFVRWVGCARPEQKIHPYLTKALASSPESELRRVWVSVFESDLGPGSLAEPAGTGHVRDADGSERVVEAHRSPVKVWRSRGWQEKALEARGVDVELFDPAVNAFRARVKSEAVPAILELDFVHALEAVLDNAPADGPSASMVNADAARAWGYTGSSGALAGVIDSGLNVAHEAFTNKAYWGWDVSANPDSPWTPSDFHGSMVAGGVFADPPGVNAHIRGYANKLGPSGNARIRIVESFNTPLSQSALFGFMQGNLDDGFGGISPPVHVYCNSYGSGAGAGPWKGTETDAIAVDAAVWNASQVVVFAAHNYGPGAGSVSIQGSAKNGLTVGNIPNYDWGHDPGEIATDSGRGPTADGRWKPNVCAPGNGTLTCSHVNNTGYVYGGGTSMAAPHVTGLVAQLCQHYSWLRYAPERVASLLMATATTRDNVELTSPGQTHHNTYGTGRVDAFRAHFQADSQVKTSNWGVALGPNQGTYADFTVEADVERLVVCLHWIEPPPSAGASKAVLNDLDLFLDAPPSLDTALNSGEYTAHQSAVDNTEIRSLPNPTPGTWRWKIYPYSAPVGSRCSVTVHKVKAAVAADTTLTAFATKYHVKPNEVVDIDATVSTPNYVASAVFLDTTATASATILGTSSTQKDGVVSDLGQCLNVVPADQGLDVTLGSVAHDDPRTASFTVRWPTEGVKLWTVQARSENMTPKTAYAFVVVDGTPPSAPSGLTSTTHVPGVWSNSPVITMTWNAASDALSGVGGYVVAFDESPTTSPAGPPTTTLTTHTAALPYGSIAWYCHVRALDNAGNYGPVIHAGPYSVDPSAPAGTVNIDLGAEATTTGVVDLYLSFTDAVSAPKDVRFLNDGGAFSPWQPYVSVKTGWSLSAFGGSTLTGTRTVRVEVRDYAGNVAPAADAIFYHAPIAYFGSSCSGAAGPPLLLLSGLPGIGKPMTAHVVNSTASQCWVGWGYSKTSLGGLPLPIDLGIVGSPGCQVYISFDGALGQGAPGPFPFVVPDSPAIVGQTFYVQAVLTGDPSGKPILSTNAAELTVAGP